MSKYLNPLSKAAKPALCKGLDRYWLKLLCCREVQKSLLPPFCHSVVVVTLSSYAVLLSPWWSLHVTVANPL
jgi:hypothetical protein